MTPIFSAGRWTYASIVSPFSFESCDAPTTTTFSPIFETSSTRSSSSESAALGPSARTRSKTCWANARKSSLFDTGSVSQPTATIVPVPSSTFARTLPSGTARSARLAADTIPRSRSSRRASSMSPSVSTRTRLHSIIPAPVSSRSSFTRLTGISAILLALLRGSGFSLLGPGGLVRDRVRTRRLPDRGVRLGGDLFFIHDLRLLDATVRGAAAGGHLLERHAPFPRLDRIGDDAADQAARADRVVVPRDHVVGVVGIAVRVDERDHREPEAARLPDRELLLLQVDNEDCVRLPLHVRDAPEVRLELLELALHRDPVLALLLRADEEDRATPLGDVPRERGRLVEEALRLLQIDDVDAAPLSEQEAAHLRIPAACLVAEVDAGLQELPHAC